MSLEGKKKVELHEVVELLNKQVVDLQQQLQNSKTAGTLALAEKEKEIEQLKKYLDDQQLEYEQALEEGYQEAFEALTEERKKNEQLEVQLYDEYTVKLNEMKKYVAEKVDQFLNVEWQQMAAAGAEEFAGKLAAFREAVTPAQIVELSLKERQQEASLRQQLKILEARNIRLQVENQKLTEAVREMSDVVDKERKRILTNEVEIE